MRRRSVRGPAGTPPYLRTRVLAGRREGGRPDDRVAGTEQARCACRGEAHVSIRRAQEVRAMRGGPKPGDDDVPWRDAVPRACVQVLAEQRIAIARLADSRARIRSARRVRELPAFRHDAPLDGGRATKCGALPKRPAAVLLPRPVHEAVDRACLSRARGVRIGLPCARPGRGEVGVPRARGAVGATDDQEGRDERDCTGSRDEPRRCSRRRHGLTVDRFPTGITTPEGARAIPRVSDPAPRQRPLGDSNDSLGWWLRHVAAATSPRASVGSTVSAR